MQENSSTNLDDSGPLKPSKAKGISGRELQFHFAWYPNEIYIFIAFTAIVWSTVSLKFWAFNWEIASKYSIQGLYPGWFGIMRDFNDFQWRAWRNKFYLMAFFAIIFLLLSRLIKNTEFNFKHRFLPIMSYYIIFGFLYLSYIFQSGMFYWLLLTLLNYTIISITARYKYFPHLIWGVSILTLYFNDVYDGYEFTWISNSEIFMVLDSLLRDAPVRWNVIFNMTLLRIISFGMDYHWACIAEHSPSRKSEDQDKVMSLRQRQEAHQPLHNYNLLHYYAYLFYTPLFISGPIITFNGWVSQIFNPQKTYTSTGILKYGLRWIVCFLCFEFWCHAFYVNALAVNPENSYIWKTFSIGWVLVLGFYVLIFIWFKFLLIWRYARLWALIDGVESPENMNRCICNNYSFEGFWRSWHRAFNQWLIRYIFIPLGGRKYKFLNVWVIFTFVAIWHEMNLNLVFWAWIICLSLMPEMAIKAYFRQKKFLPLWNKVWFRYLSSVGGTFIVILLVLSNLVGYGMGYQALLAMLKQAMHLEGILTIILSFLGIFGAVNVMFYQRDLEEKSEMGAKGF